MYQRKLDLHRQNPDDHNHAMPTPMTIKVKDPEASDTESTSDEDDIGGQGKFSHGDLALVHQHWVESIMSSGCFGVHCTEAAEAYHKVCMRRYVQT